MTSKIITMIAIVMGLATTSVMAGVSESEYAFSTTNLDLSLQINTFDGALSAVDWLTNASFRIKRFMRDDDVRIAFLRQVHYESLRAGVDPNLVLALIHVESGFKQYVVSTAGAVGYMQVMPFWKKHVGQIGDSLFDLRTNLRYGCTVLRYYMDLENGDVSRALARYNGSLGSYEYPNLVLKVGLTHYGYSMVIPPQ